MLFEVSFTHQRTSQDSILKPQLCTKALKVPQVRLGEGLRLKPHLPGAGRARLAHWAQELRLSRGTLLPRAALGTTSPCQWVTLKRAWQDSGAGRSWQVEGSLPDELQAQCPRGSPHPALMAVVISTAVVTLAFTVMTLRFIR